MGPIWGRQDPGGPRVGPMNFAIWDMITARILYTPITDICQCVLPWCGFTTNHNPYFLKKKDSTSAVKKSSHFSFLLIFILQNYINSLVLIVVSQFLQHLRYCSLALICGDFLSLSFILSSFKFYISINPCPFVPLVGFQDLSLLSAKGVPLEVSRAAVYDSGQVWVKFNLYWDHRYPREASLRGTEAREEGRGRGGRWDKGIFLQCTYNAPKARFMAPARGPPGDDRTQVGPMLAT